MKTKKVDSVGMFTWADMLKLLVPIVATFGLWYLNSELEFWRTQQLNKERNYRELVSTVRGFNVNGSSFEQREKFVDQINQSWLYAPDTVIRLAYRFIGRSSVGANYTNFQRDSALGDLFLAMRHDMLQTGTTKHTSLSASDYKNLAAAPIPSDSI